MSVFCNAALNEAWQGLTLSLVFQEAALPLESPAAASNP